MRILDSFPHGSHSQACVACRASKEGTAGCCGSEQAAFSCSFGLGAVQSRASPCLGAQQAGAAPQVAGRMGPAAWHGQQVAPSFPQLASSLFIEALS